MSLSYFLNKYNFIKNQKDQKESLSSLQSLQQKTVYYCLKCEQIFCSICLKSLSCKCESCNRIGIN
jgi:hypothetical protein